MSSKSTKNGVLFYPPPNFSYFDEHLSRCTMPITQNNAVFWQNIGMKRVLNYSGKELDGNVLTFCETKSIKVQHVDINHPEYPRHDVDKFQEWIALCLQDIILHCKYTPTIIIGCADNCIDCLLLACWRKLQAWSIVSIIAEFRFLIWPHRMYEFEQVIECFDGQRVNLTGTAPAFLTTHEAVKMEEKRLMTRSSLPTNNNEQHHAAEIKEENGEAEAAATAVAGERMDSVWQNLCFHSTPNKLLSADYTFDPALSLIFTDKYDSQDCEQLPIDRVLCDLFFNEPYELLTVDSTLDPAITDIQDDD